MTAVVVSVVDSMCHAKLNATANCSVSTSVKRNVVTLVIPVPRDVPGSAHIINARNCAERFAIVHDAMSRAQSYFPRANTPVSVSVGKCARRSAESVTKTR